MTEQQIAFEQFTINRLLRSGEWESDLHAAPLDGDLKSDLLAFHVNSLRKGEPSHLVRLDLNMNRRGSEFNGACDCEDFTMRCLPNFHKNAKEILGRYNSDAKSRTRCKHIELALLELARRVVCRLSTPASS